VTEVFNATPDEWQKEALEAFASGDKEKQRISLRACSGPGKSSVLAWVGWNFLLCYGETGHHPNGIATSVSYDNLKDNLWKEFSVWQGRSKILSKAFVWTKERIFAKDHPPTWFISARTWSKNANPDEQGRTLSGLHSKYILYLIDESGDINPSILKAAEQGLSNCTFGKIVQAGNPISEEGILYLAATKLRHQWFNISITGDPDDPKRSTRIDSDWAREQIRLYGKDDPWVQAYILGKFPKGGLQGIISPDEVEEAMTRSLRPEVYNWSQKRIGIDVARTGGDMCFDDKTEILTNEGWKLFSILRGDEKVFSVGVNEDKASWERIDFLHKAEWDGDMYLCRKRSLNFCVTPNHRMFVRTSPKKREYKFEAYQDLPNEFVIREKNGWSGQSPEIKKFLCVKQMPHGGKFTREFVFTMDDWAEFLGWFVSKGCVWKEKRKNGRYRILIAQKAGTKKQKMISDLLDRMEVGYKFKGHTFDFSNNKIGQWLIEHCCKYARNKRVPKEIKDGSERIIQKFLDSFLLGAGSKKKDGSGRCYFSSSKLLIDDLQEMLAKLGRAGLVNIRQEAGSIFYIEGRKVVRKHRVYTLFERSYSGGSNGKYCLKKNVKKINYKGTVWCVATNKESIYVRRNGIPMWSGNTVLFPRQGLQAFKQVRMKHRVNDPVSVDIANRVVEAKLRWQSEIEFFDDTVGWAHGAIDVMRGYGYSPQGIAFHWNADDPRFFNKRAEMWHRLIMWIKGGGALPKDDSFVRQICTPKWGFKNGKTALEEKEQIKKRLKFSPDDIDALSLSFAIQDCPASNSLEMQFSGAGKLLSEYDPFDPKRL